MNRFDLRNTPLNILLHEAAEKNAEKTAVIDGGRTYSYAEMEKYSNAVCGLLMNMTGSCKSRNICLYFDNTAQKLFSVEGVIKAGLTYVPFDIRAGINRNSFILKNVGGDIILTDDRDYATACELAREAGLAEEKVFIIDDDILENGCHSFCNQSREELAYIIHTSGSTGRPKGVMVLDSGLELFCENILNRQYITEYDTVGVMQNFSFDFSVIDMFPAMLCGAAMVCVPDEVHRDVYKLHDFIDDMGLTVLGMPTALYHMYLGTGDNKTLKRLLIGGEKMLSYEKRSYDVVNLYGPTETTVFVSSYDVRDKLEDYPIGRPFDDVEMYIVRDDGTLANSGETGEICITGGMLAKGYINLEEETAKYFVPSVIDGGERMYRTGDLGYVDENGMFYCLGRKDFQVKLNGYRIEPEEVNLNIKNLEGVSDSAVIFNDDNVNPCLVCFYCSAEDVSVKELKAALAEKVPEYMIPARWQRIDSIPLNNNRKVDRAALKALVNDSRRTLSEYSENETEAITVRRIWAELTGSDENFAPEDTFSDLGGNSIMAMIMIGRVRDATGIDVTPSDFFDNNTFEKFMYMLRSKTKDSSASEKLIRNDEERFEPFPLNEMQLAYFVGRESDVGLGNTPTHLYFELGCKNFDEARFTYALEKTVEKHDALRIRIYPDGTQRALRYNKGELDLSIKEFFDIAEAERFCRESRTELISCKLNCETEPPLRTVVIKCSVSAMIQIYLDGLIADGWSQQIIINDICGYYEGKADSNGDDTETLRFRDYNLYLEGLRESEEYKSSLEFWEKRAAELGDIPFLPIKTDPECVDEPTLVFESCLIDEAVWSGFEAACTENHLTPYSALITIFGNILAGYTRNDRFLVNTPVLRRYFKDAEFKDTVGTCSSFALFESDCDGTLPFSEAARRNQIQSENIVKNSSVSGIQILNAVKSVKNDRMFSVPIVFTSNLDAPELSSDNFTQEWSETRTSQMWLDVFITRDNGKIRVIWNYVRELFESTMIKDMMNSFSSEIERLSDKSAFYEPAYQEGSNKFADIAADMICKADDRVESCSVVIENDEMKLYYTTDELADSDEIKQELDRKLPGYMRFAEVTEVFELPRGSRNEEC